MKALLSSLEPRQWAAVIACVVLLVLAIFLKFCVPGYSFSALVCLCILGVIVFYNVMPMVGQRFPTFARVTTQVVTVLLLLGAGLASVTEGLILRASFGNPQQEVDYIVVLGAKVNPDGPSVSLWDRITAAYHYLEAHPNVVAVLSGGQGADEPMSEAACMYQELVTLGIAPKQLRIEDAATSTWENLKFSLDLLEAETGQRPTRLGVLSSEYHLFRAELQAKKAGITEFVGIPARTSHVTQSVNHFLREVAGVWHYLLLGGQYD